LIALIGGVRPQHIQQARSCGASRVLAKLSPVTNIMAELSDVIRERSAA